jgi:hypothetical protein
MTALATLTAFATLTTLTAKATLAALTTLTTLATLAILTTIASLAALTALTTKATQTARFFIVFLVHLAVFATPFVIVLLIFFVVLVILILILPLVLILMSGLIILLIILLVPLLVLISVIVFVTPLLIVLFILIVPLFALFVFTLILTVHVIRLFRFQLVKTRTLFALLTARFMFLHIRVSLIGLATPVGFLILTIATSISPAAFLALVRLGCLILLIVIVGWLLVAWGLTVLVTTSWGLVTSWRLPSTLLIVRFSTVLVLGIDSWATESFLTGFVLGIDAWATESLIAGLILLLILFITVFVGFRAGLRFLILGVFVLWIGTIANFIAAWLFRGVLSGLILGISLIEPTAEQQWIALMSIVCLNKLKFLLLNDCLSW